MGKIHLPSHIADMCSTKVVRPYLFTNSQHGMMSLHLLADDV